MRAAAVSGGAASGVLAHALARTRREPQARWVVAEGGRILVTPCHPYRPFNVSNAMAGNTLIYALAGYALVAASDLAKGRTWIGAAEALRQQEQGPRFQTQSKQSYHYNRCGKEETERTGLRAGTGGPYPHCLPFPQS